MASFFPTPYPDELLYSAIARYHVRSGITSPKATIKELFASRTATAVVDMPCNIDALVKAVPTFLKLKAEQLIQEHTLYPYYMVFQTNDKCSKIMQAMRSSYGGDIHTRVGIMASSVKNLENLRFCHKCMETDLKVYGEYYWHRIHQVPGVMVCPEHGVLIQDSNANLLKTNKHEFIAADDTNCINRSEVNYYSSLDTARLYELSKDIQWLFNNYEKVRNSSNYKNGLRNSYLSVLKNKGLATTNGRVYQAEFCSDFVSFYKDSFLSIVQSSIGSDYEDSWVANILRKHRKAFHPLRHLLLIRYLVGDIKNFFEETEHYLPFGNGPWPCLNPIATHYKNFVVKELKVTHCADTKLPVGTFNCECGFVYTRSGPDKTDLDIYKIGRIKQFGVEWEQKLTFLSKNKELSLREIARQMGCDINTVKKYIGKLKISDLSNENICTSEISNNANNLNIQQMHRYRWLDLINQNPSMTKTQLRQLAKASFAWLYRHDQNWLNENSSRICYENTDYERVDWEKRDESILEKVKKVVNEILASKEKPQRITISSIGKKIGLLSLIEKHMDKMPKTKVFINSVVENGYDYRKRRVIWVIHMLHASGEELKEWKILRIAGIRTEYYEEVKNVIEKEIEVISRGTLY